MSKKTIVIVLVVAVVAVAAWWFFIRRRVAIAGAMNGAMPTEAKVLPPIPPPPGSPGSGFSLAGLQGQVIGTGFQKVCGSLGGTGGMCDVAGKVGSTLGKLQVQQFTVPAKSLWSGTKSLVGKIF
jgi:hypothetical protein